MLFEKYEKTGMVYHIAPIIDLGNILQNGIKYNDKNTYLSKYLDFHNYIDSLKPKSIPLWVQRKKAIFASLNFTNDHSFHSHSVIIGLRINPRKCWIANENLANEIYEPFILKDVKGFECAEKFIKNNGRQNIRKYWDTSLSFIDNLKYKKENEKGYDTEVLIFDNIKREDISIMKIVSDHKMMNVEEWKKLFLNG